MRDDDFDRRRVELEAQVDVATESRVPGKQTLVEAELDGSSGSQDGAGIPGKRTLVEQRYGGGGLHGDDAVLEAERCLAKARELIRQLAGNVGPRKRHMLRWDLSRTISAARDVAGSIGRDPRALEIHDAVLRVMIEGRQWEEMPDHAPAVSHEPISNNPSAGDAPASIAARGLEGPGEALPHHDEVQRLMGAHDLSGVRAHVGGKAAEASAKLGAHAYTVGDQIAFASAPSLELVAHEATHVVQQRAGVAKKGIDGGASDTHEQQADAVASLVAHGESADALLSSFVRGGSGAASGGTVQRKTPATTATSNPPAGHAGSGAALAGPYDVAADGMSARVRSAWVGDDAARWFEVLAAMRGKGAVPWADDAALHRFAALLVERNRHSVEVIPLRLDAAAIAVIGLPKDATPVVEATPEGLQVAIAGLAGPQLDFVLDLGPQQPELLAAVYTALDTSPACTP